MKLYASLHTHTTHSDGFYTPRELVRRAKDEGYGAVAISDHDTVSAWAEMKDECEKIGMEYVYACEFSSPCKHLGTSFHIVGFSFDADYAPMREYLERCSTSESYQTKVLFERAVSLDIIKGITWDDVLEYNKGINWLCNEHVFRTMKARGLAEETDYPAFFENAYGPHRAEVELPYEFIDAAEIINLIHSAGGIAVVAHPANQLKYIDELISMGIDGIEVWHQNLKRSEKLEALNLARVHNLFVSGGSDHEGLLGGQYSRFEDPKVTYWYAPECSLGTTKEFFNEIKCGKKSPDRDAYFDAALAEMTA